MDFGSGQGVNRSNSSTIARIYNAALAQKTRFYGLDSVQHHTNDGLMKRPEPRQYITRLQKTGANLQSVSGEAVAKQ